MAGFDWEKFGQNIVDATKSHVERSLEPIMRRLDALEKLPTPKDGKDADSIDMDAVRSIIVEECKDIRAGLESTIGPEMQEALSVMVKEAVGALPVPRDGTDGKDAEPVDMDAVRGLVDTAVETRMVSAVEYVDSLVKETVAALPAPKDAEPVDLDAMADRVRGMIVLPEIILPDIAGMVDAAVKAIPVPLAPELPDIAGMVADAMTKGIEDYHKLVREIPVPQDGKSVTVDDVRPLIDDAVSKAVAQIPVPKDGRDGADVTAAVIDREGHLHFTLSNGQTKDIGQVVGDDGVDCDFQRVDERIAADIKSLFDAQPKPRDGFGFDDLSVEYDGERTIKMVFMRNGERKEFPIIMPVVLDRGVYAEGKTYDRGDSVTWAGARWIAQKDGATEKPGTNGDWLLSVKRGRDGKDGVMTVAKPPAPVKLGGK